MRAGRHRALTAGLVLTVTLVGFESLAVSTALPAITEDLHGDSGYGWVFSAYMLGNLLGIVVAGRSADRRGPAVPFVTGLGVFAVALVAAGLAPGMTFLIGARFVQGLGGGAIPAVAYVAAGRGYSADEQPRVFAILSTAWVVPGVIGPSISAAITEYADWRWVFFGLLPLVPPALALTVPSLRRLGPPPAVATRRSVTVHAVVLVAGAAAVLGALGGVDARAAIPLAVAGAAAAVCAFTGLTPRGVLWAAPGIAATVALRGVQTFAFFGADAFVPRLVHDVRGQSNLVTGVAVTGGTLAWTTAAWVAARVIARSGARRLVVGGLAIIAAGNVAPLFAADTATPVALAVAGATIAGFGMGLGYSPISVTLLAQAPTGEEGFSSAALSLTDALGIALGTGLGGACVHLAIARGWSDAAGVQLAIVAPLVVALAGVVLATRRVPPPAQRHSLFL